jgi:ribosomal subunit interface protein
MSFPHITFKHNNSDAKRSIDDFASQKLSVLEKYIGDETDVICEVEFEKAASQNSGAICRVEVNLWVGGVLYRAESTQITYEAAVDIVKDELDREMRKANSKRSSLMRKGGRMIKEMIRFGK